MTQLVVGYAFGLAILLAVVYAAIKAHQVQEPTCDNQCEQCSFKCKNQLKK